MRKLTLSAMKQMCTDFFFSKETRRAFKGSRNKAFHVNGRNFIRVTHKTGRTAWYSFSKSGKTNYLTIKDLPSALRKRLKL